MLISYSVKGKGFGEFTFILTVPLFVSFPQHPTQCTCLKTACPFSKHFLSLHNQRIYVEITTNLNVLFMTYFTLLFSILNVDP